MSVPNLKRIALFVPKLLGSPEIMKLGHMTPATPTYGSFCGPDAVGVRPLCLCQIRSGYLYLFQSYKGGPNISKLGHVTQATPTYGSFYDLDEVGVRPVCLCEI